MASQPVSKSSNAEKLSPLRQTPNFKSGVKPASNSTNLSIISLSKLKNYMPQNQAAAKLFPASSSHQPPKSTPTTPVARYRCSLDQQNDASVAYSCGNHEKLARAKSLSLSPSLSFGRSDRNTPIGGVSVCYRSVANQVVAQQELSIDQQRNSITDSQRSSATGSTLDKVRGEGSHIEQQEHSANKGGRKRKKIDSPDSKELREEKRQGEEYRSSHSKNNMTPSSSLLLPNHNYTDQQQQCNTGNYNESNHIPQQLGDGTTVGQSRISAENCGRGAAKRSDVQHQAQCNEQAQSLSSLMSTNTNQFKALESIGNTSIGSRNNLSVTSSTNLVESSDYLANQNLNQIQSQLSETANSINNLQHNYHQPIPASCDLKVTGGSSHFVHYSTPNSRLSSGNYHSSFPTSMLEQQIKLENVVNSRNIFEENSSIAFDNSSIPGGNQNTGSLTACRDLAQQQQVRNNSHHYYNNHYTLMPTSSSKSSSPTSTTSTPSPKTNAMHATTSQHSNQLVSSTGASSSSSQQIHHLNHHYMSNTATVNQHHQVNQHYTYNQQTTSAPNQHHVTMTNHDQSYSHQQQHHSIQNQQSIYHQIANNAANVNHIYSNNGNNAQYQGHLQGNSGNHQSNHLMPCAHQSHLNSAAAACAAAAVVSQTLKTVANQHSQQHHYGGPVANNFGATTGSLMNMTTQSHQQFNNVNQLNHHHLGNQVPAAQQQHHNLPAHHTTSIVTRKYQCKMCPQVFTSKAEMKYHNQNHMREAKPYKCLQCPKAFANSSYLSQHMRIHQGVKPYTCDICSRKFTQLSHLQQHKRTHTGDKPYKCNYMNCTKQFSQLSNLQSHSRCHQLDKPYKCNSCYKCFHDEQSLLEHIPRHLESKHLKKNLCIFCGSSYQQERGLVKHFQQYHTDKTPTLVAAAIAAGTTGNTNLIASLVTSNPSNTFATPSNSSSSSSSSSISSSGSLNVHNNLNTVNGNSGGQYQHVGNLF